MLSADQSARKACLGGILRQRKNFYPTMKPEDLEKLEQEAEEGCPEACVKLSFHLMSTDPVNPENLARAGAFNRKAVGKFKDSLIQSIGRPSFAASDIVAACKLHLGILYELAPHGINRRPVSGFYLIQDALRSFKKGNPHFPISNYILENLKSFGYGVYPEEPEEPEVWRTLEKLKEELDTIEKCIHSKNEGLQQGLLKLLDSLINLGVDREESEKALFSEVLYYCAKVKYLTLELVARSEGFRSEKPHWEYSWPSLSNAFCNLDRLFNVVGNDFDLSAQSLSPAEAEITGLFNECIELLLKSSSLSNGKATMELGAFYDRLSEEREPEGVAPLQQKAIELYGSLARTGDARALLDLGNLKVGRRHLSGTESKFSENDISNWFAGLDLLGPSEIGHEMYFLVQQNDFVSKRELLKYLSGYELNCDNVDEVFPWESSIAEIASGESMFKVWKKTIRFISDLRLKKPLSFLAGTAEKFSSFKIVPSSPSKVAFDWDAFDEDASSESSASEVRPKAAVETFVFKSFDVFPPIIKLK